ncbi:Putative protein C18orf25 [Chelonia mydas]|uniref:Uncharacterized protein n=1 Tax=Chelonia mydas TaxID=8469 RepID=M7BQD6_CHEMY|nr:Putative protein C18orf25 [Chelonia mydas]
MIPSASIASTSIPGHLDPGFLASERTSSGNAQINEEINIASSDSEVEIVGVQEHARPSKSTPLHQLQRRRFSMQCRQAQRDCHFTLEQCTVTIVFLWTQAS